MRMFSLVYVSVSREWWVKVAFLVIYSLIYRRLYIYVNVERMFSFLMDSYKSR